MKEMKEELKNTMIVKTFVGIVLFIANIGIGMFTTAYLWNNIMAQLFELPLLTIIQAFAVDLFITYIVSSESTNKTYMESVTLAITKSLLFLFIGFIVIKFI